MMRRTVSQVIALAIALIIILIAITVYRSTHAAKQSAASQSAVSQSTAAAGEKKVLYWYDPMQPEQHFDKPGKSPFMDMELVPRYAATKNSAHESIANNLTIDARNVQKLGVRLATVERGAIATPLTAVGSIVFNERDTTILQTRAAGFVQRVYNLAVGDSVKRGAPLVDLLVPEWFAVQQELLALQTSGDSSLVAAARARAQALGMSDADLAELERNRQARQIFTISAPQAGVIKALDVRAGMNLIAGAPLITLNGIDRVWLEMAVPQAAASTLAIGARLEASFNALPASKQNGNVIAILPESDAATRTVRVRAELQNPRGDLRPGLLAQVHFIDADARSVLSIPSAAVIRSAQQNRVIVANDDGTFTPTLVTIGREDRDHTEILQGLEVGQQVVASGQFLIDSEANLNGQLNRLGNIEPQP